MGWWDGGCAPRRRSPRARPRSSLLLTGGTLGTLAQDERARAHHAPRLLRKRKRRVPPFAALERAHQLGRAVGRRGQVPGQAHAASQGRAGRVARGPAATVGCGRRGGGRRAVGLALALVVVAAVAALLVLEQAGVLKVKGKRGWARARGRFSALCLARRTASGPPAPPANERVECRDHGVGSAGVVRRRGRTRARRWAPAPPRRQRRPGASAGRDTPDWPPNDASASPSTRSPRAGPSGSRPQARPGAGRRPRRAPRPRRTPRARRARTRIEPPWW